ncbi:E3 ubiquitin/ISG15 ligase TRIM25-like [Solea senegalensis]|uniref:E3 ubiquitin/ISG15 ligase TRIM25-like n=1 Tax=Solea senegalensis TaxID=28829 RepID=A0AAV6PE85_SOLSE|nr:E3 ubiquitin/ISG15 ligase TRIM25-like [Solea senegalensis]
MAQSGLVLDKDQFNCSICLDVLKEPVTIPCGHSYCLVCIQNYWDQDDYLGSYVCPQCRHTSSPRPVLARNTMLADVVEKFKKNGLQEATTDANQSFAEAGDVQCDVCTGRKNKAVKSCLVCLASYCDVHVQPHYESVAFKKHRLVSASKKLQETICPRHDKLLEVFCRTDGRCICYLCLTDEHKGHDTVLAEQEIQYKQTQLNDMKKNSLLQIQLREKDAQELRHAIFSLTHATEAAVEESERIFSRLIRSLEKQSSEVTELIRVQERAAVSQTEERLEKVQREMVELRRTEAELEKLCHNDDHIHFLQKCKSLHFPTKTVETPSVDTLPYLMYKTMREGLADVKDSVDEIFQKEFNRVSEKVISLKESSNHGSSEKTKAVKSVDIPYNTEPKTRGDFLQYYNDITFDPNTANPYLCFSDGLRGVTTRSEPQPYPEHPDRFTSWAQVLCRAGMAGRCYWEVEWTGNGGASMGVCYKNMSRSGGGSDSKLGHNSKSWSLDCSYSLSSFQHNKESVAIPGPSYSRVGVYLDFRGGTLTFYGVSDTMVLLHKVKTTFTQPVYPGFWIGLGSSLKLISH